MLGMPVVSKYVRMQMEAGWKIIKDTSEPDLGKLPVSNLRFVSPPREEWRDISEESGEMPLEQMIARIQGWGPGLGQMHANDLFMRQKEIPGNLRNDKLLFSGVLWQPPTPRTDLHMVVLEYHLGYDWVMGFCQINSGIPWTGYVVVQPPSR